MAAPTDAEVIKQFNQEMLENIDYVARKWPANTFAIFVVIQAEYLLGIPENGVSINIEDAEGYPKALPIAGAVIDDFNTYSTYEAAAAHASAIQAAYDPNLDNYLFVAYPLDRRFFDDALFELPPTESTIEIPTPTDS